jgi:predicted dehydrogenase
MPELNVGIVGLGAMGTAHLAALSRMRDVTVCWAADSDADALERASTTLGIDRVSADFRDFLESGADAVVVATPEAYHAEPVIDFLRSGSDVFVEKPLATNADEARLMAEEAEQTGRLLVPGLNLRYDPRFRMIRDWIVDGRDGGLVSMAFRRNRPAPLFETYSRVHPGFETGSHDVDLALWYAQDRIKRIFAVERQRDGDENPFGIWALAEFAGGVIATFETVWLIPHEARVDRDDIVEVVGNAGTARIDVIDPGITFLDENGRYSKDPIYDQTSLNAVSLALSFELDEFIATVRGDCAAPAFSLADAVHGVEVIEAMVASAQSGERVEIASAVGV